MSELEKKARQLTDEEMEQVTGGTNKQTDKDPKDNNNLGSGNDVNNEGPQGRSMPCHGRH